MYALSRRSRFPTVENNYDKASLAVAYVRMSTDLQKYSTEHQLEKIRLYATHRGFEIIRIYEDAGRSGLRVDGREGLQRLMRDVQSPNPGFDVILVYDVSRWGRFQDADESAYHEHLCSRAGIRVHYCGEQFNNDGSIGSILLKSVKRVMAGEYSRELSVKVFAGQCRLIEHGFRQGGPAGFGLRRLLIDEKRNEKGVLQRGDRKSLQTDRVVLTLGPPEELIQVQRIYSMFVDSGRTEREIADILNAERQLSDMGKPWSRASIHQILTNEKYIGNNVFNRVSFKLKQRRTTNPPDTWVRSDGAFPSAVDIALFERARAIVDARSRYLSDADLLSFLREILKEEGFLSGLVIDERENIPSSSAYRYRFGSLLRAYTLIGYVPDRDYRYIEINRTLRQAHPGILSDIMRGIQNAGGVVALDPDTELLTINEEVTASLIVARSFQEKNGTLRWRLRFDTGLVPDLTIAVRMNGSNTDALDYYIFPTISLSAERIKLSEDNALSFDAYRFESLNFFYGLTSRSSFSEVA